jgi:hypothetical protein
MQMEHVIVSGWRIDEEDALAIIETYGLEETTDSGLPNRYRIHRYWQLIKYESWYIALQERIIRNDKQIFYRPFKQPCKEEMDGLNEYLGECGIRISSAIKQYELVMCAG